MVIQTGILPGVIAGGHESRETTFLFSLPHISGCRTVQPSIAISEHSGISTAGVG